MSSSPSNEKLKYEAARTTLLTEIEEGIYASLKERVVELCLTSADEFMGPVEMAFKINRWELVTKVLKKLTENMEKGPQHV